jgi:hypothetical protein
VPNLIHYTKALIKRRELEFYSIVHTQEYLIYGGSIYEEGQVEE